jgi:PAS domain S-box-containing protein
MKKQTERQVRAELKRVQARVAELEATVQAIRSGDVDGIVVDGPQGSHIFTLQSPEEPYRVLAERMNEGAATLTAEGTILFCNPRLAEMVGLPCEKLLGSSFLSILRDGEHENFPELARQVSKKDLRTEGHLRRKDGTLLPVQLSLSSIPLEESAHGICLVATDLSDRKRAEQQLREHAALLDLAHDAVILRCLEGRILFWNRGAKDLYGWTAEEAVGKISHELLQTEFPEPLKEIEVFIQETRKWEGELKHISREGKAILVASRWSLLRDEQGKATAILEINRDITERKRAEEKLRIAALYARSLLEASLDPLVTISREGKITDGNEAATRVAGVSRERLIGSDFSDYFTDPEGARRGYAQVFAQGAVQDYPLAIRSTSGKVTDVLYNASVFRNEAGKVEGVFAAARDITEKKRAQEAVAAERQKFNNILDVLPPYVVLLTPDYHVAFANREFTKRFGESGGRRCFEFLFNRSEPCEICETYKVLTAKNPLQWKWTGPDGRHYDVYDFPFTDTDGTTLILEMGIDVTERKRAERALRTLSACNESLVRAADEQSLLQRICDLVVTVGGYRMAWVGYAEHDERKTVRAVAESGFEAGYLETVHITWAEDERGRGPTGTAIRTGNAAVCRDVTSDPRFAPWRENAIKRGYRSTLVLPLKSKEEVLGAISIYAAEAGAFDAGEQHLLGELADNLSYGIAALRAAAERKRAEEEIRKLNQELEGRVQQRTAQLHESETRVRRKLDSILSPEGDLGSLDLADLLDIPAVQSLADDVYKLVQIPIFILDLKGIVLVSVGWQEVCTKFHRVHPEACRNCEESDRELSAGVAPGEFKLYKCKNHLWDVVTPIMLGEQQVGNLFSGQFFFSDDTVDYDLFRSQARRYGFDEPEYLAALERVPRLSRTAVEASMKFYTKLAQLLSQLSYSGIQLARSMTETGRANAELAASVKELEAFTYSVSHDLRAPLRHISGFSKILSEEFGPNLPDDAQCHLQRIQDGTRRMGRLVDDLLNLARVGRRDLSLRVSGLKSVVDEVIAELAPEYGNRQIEWKIGDLPFVQCDPGLMKQVFQNLISNALKFTRPRSQSVIEIGQTDEHGSPVLFVRDNGVGFDMKYADKLFGVFQRLHRAEDFEGTGVGLATVQRIVQKHGAASGPKPNWTRVQLFTSLSEVPRRANFKQKRRWQESKHDPTTDRDITGGRQSR